MSWPGHVIVTGAMGSGKTTWLLSEWLRTEERGILYDPAGDIHPPAGCVLAGPRSSAKAFRAALAAGAKIVYRTELVDPASCARDIDYLVRRLVAAGGGTLAGDEAHLYAAQGRVAPGLRDAWVRGRHLGIRIILATPVPQVVDHELRITAATWVVFPLAWNPWMAEHGISREAMESLHRAAPHSWLRAEGGQVTGPHPPLRA
ncbi:MAG: hypothetical protein IRY83_14930 [Chloroflexi bacterium]|nr:hypothetical protein [Chloroflexota bacterium]